MESLNELKMFIMFIGELLVIVEYCRYGSLQTYLTNHRNGFIDMVDEFGNMISDKDEEYDYNAR